MTTTPLIINNTTRLDDLENSTNLLSSRLDQLGVSDLWTAVENSKTQSAAAVGDLLGRINALDDTLWSSFSTLNASVAALTGGDNADLMSRINALNVTIASLSSTNELFSRINATMASLSSTSDILSRIDALNATIARLSSTTDVTNLLATINILNATVMNLSSTNLLATINATLSSLSGNSVTDLVTRIDSLNTTLSSLSDSSVTDLVTRINMLNSTLLSLSSNNTLALWSALSDLSARVNTLAVGTTTTTTPPVLPVGFEVRGPFTSNSSRLLGTYGDVKGDFVAWWKEVAPRTFAVSVAHVSGASWTYANSTWQDTRHNVTEASLGTIHLITHETANATCFFLDVPNNRTMAFRVSTDTPGVIRDDVVLAYRPVKDMDVFALDSTICVVLQRYWGHAATTIAYQSIRHTNTLASYASDVPLCQLTTNAVASGVQQKVELRIPPAHGLLSRSPDGVFYNIYNAGKLLMMHAGETGFLNDAGTVSYGTAVVLTSPVFRRLVPPSVCLNIGNFGTITAFAQTNSIWNLTLSSNFKYVAYVVEMDVGSGRGPVCVSPFSPDFAPSAPVSSVCDPTGANGHTPKFASNGTLAYIRHVSNDVGNDWETWTRQLVLSRPEYGYTTPVAVWSTSEEVYVAGWGNSDTVWLYGSRWMAYHVPSGRLLVPAMLPPLSSVIDVHYVLDSVNNCVRVFGPNAPAGAVCVSTNGAASSTYLATTAAAAAPSSITTPLTASLNCTTASASSSPLVLACPSNQYISLLSVTLSACGGGGSPIQRPLVLRTLRQTCANKSSSCAYTLPSLVAVSVAYVCSYRYPS